MYVHRFTLCAVTCSKCLQCILNDDTGVSKGKKSFITYSIVGWSKPRHWFVVANCSWPCQKQNIALCGFSRRVVACYTIFYNKFIEILKLYAPNSPNTITPVAPAFSQTLALSINVHDPLLTTQNLPCNNSASTNCNEQVLLLLGIFFTYRKVKRITVRIRSKTFLGTFHNKFSDYSPMIVNQRATNLHRGFPRTRR